MNRASWTIKILYSAVFIGTLGCSAAKPSAPVKRTQTNTGTQTAATNDTKAENEDTSSDATAGEENETPAPEPTPTPTAPAPFALISPAFANMGAIPTTYVAKNNGGNQSPPLQWKNVPTGTGYFAIQMVDLDFLNPNPAPFIHWMITNIPVASTQLPAAVPGGNNLAAPAEAVGASQMKNYAGPNPPNLHRYEWTIYAIKQGETLTLTNNSMTNKTELEAKSLGKATLIGTFQ